MPAHSRTRDQIQQLLALAAPVNFFRSVEGQAWASIARGEYLHQIVPVLSPSFRDWLIHGYRTRHHAAPAPYCLRQALRTLAASAFHSSAYIREVWRRIDGDASALILDLDGRHVVEIDSRGWRLAPNAGCCFRSSPEFTGLPEPKCGAALEDLRAALNLSDHNWDRCQAWLFAAFRPRGPYPILIIQGPPGRARSTLARRLRSLLDPSHCPASEMPRTERGLLKLAYANRVLFFDQLSQLSELRSLALAKIADGAGFALQEPYSDRGPVQLEVCCPVILTVTEHFRPHPELAARAILIELPPEHQPIPEPAWEQARPRLLGALCTALAQSLEPDPGFTPLPAPEIVPVPAPPPPDQPHSARAP